MSIHQRIRDGRLKLGLTEQAFADRIGVTRGSVQQWEKEGGTAPSRRHQPAVAKALGISVSDLMHNTGSLTSAIGPLSGGGAGRTAQATVWQAVVAIGLALESVDQITRDQAAPLLVALTKEPKRAEEFAGRLEVTLKSGNGGPGESGQRTGTHG